MKDESFGIIPIRIRNGKAELLLVCHQAGHWSFPKGHAEKGETPHEAAIRELREETQLSITKLLDKEPLSESYIFRKSGKVINKQVTYFFALVEGELAIDGLEIVEAGWFDPESAYARATFPELKRLIKESVNYLSSANLSL